MYNTIVKVSSCCAFGRHESLYCGRELESALCFWIVTNLRDRTSGFTGRREREEVQ